MHRALQLHDIIYTIFRHIHEPLTYSHQMLEDDDVFEHYSRWTRSVMCLVEPRNNVGQMTLAALASTCRLFQEPALDILWADLCFPYPLIRCLPDWRDRWRSDHANILSARDWEVLQKYVPLVRSLTFLSNSRDLYRYRDVLNALRQPPVAQPPLPNLQRLDYRHHVPEDYPLLDIFFVPSLTDLTIEIRHTRLPNISFISPLATLCPHLTSFRVFGYGTHEPTVATVSNVITSLPRLQTLHSDHLSQAAINFVACHPSLTELDISITSDHPYKFPQYLHHSIPPFSQIKSFAARSTHLTAITAFIEMVQLSLSHLCVTTRQEVSTKDLQEFFNILSNQRIHESLQILQVHWQSTSFFQTLPDGIIDICTIEPLLRFSRLRELHLLTDHSVHLSDEELAAMGASWPCLEVINLNNGKGLREVPSPNLISLRGLILLVNKTRLRKAHLMIKGDGLELIEKCPTSMVGTNDFEHLMLADTTVENPRDFALIVSLAFPKVKEIVVNSTPRIIDEGRQTCPSQWDTVNEYLQVFKLFRQGLWRN